MNIDVKVEERKFWRLVVLSGKWCPAQHREAVSPVNQFSPSRDTCWSVSRVTCHAQPRVLLSGDEY